MQGFNEITSSLSCASGSPYMLFPPGVTTPPTSTPVVWLMPAILPVQLKCPFFRGHPGSVQCPVKSTHSPLYFSSQLVTAVISGALCFLSISSGQTGAPEETAGSAASPSAPSPAPGQCRPCAERTLRKQQRPSEDPRDGLWL